jgi:hypothetical protein
VARPNRSGGPPVQLGADRPPAKVGMFCSGFTGQSSGGFDKTWKPGEFELVK